MGCNCIKGLGQDASQIDPGDTWEAMTEVDINGERWWRLQVAKVLWANMGNQVAVLAASPTANLLCYTLLDQPVAVVNPTIPQQIAAATMSSGYALYANMANAIPAVMAPKMMCVSYVPKSPPDATFARMYPAPGNLSQAPYTAAAVQPPPGPPPVPGAPPAEAGPGGMTTGTKGLIVAGAAIVGLGAIWAWQKYGKK
jgi:hypothetical protein